MIDPKQSASVFWITVALLAALVVFPLSMGPACWISSRMNSGMAAVELIYQPLMRACWHGATPSGILWKYVVWGSVEWWFFIPDGDGFYHWEDRSAFL